ncbi:MAG TPA: hypothetical protein VN633_09135 [Bryobacteraceae bacterium]|nr:hypothetical protein [Bryobacteraceae bacterium]
MKPVLAIFLLISYFPLLHAQATASFPKSAEARHQRYTDLNRQIYRRHDDPDSGKLRQFADKANYASQQLQEMISQEIERALASRASNASIVSAISNLQGDLSMSKWVDDMDIPFAKLFSLNDVPTLAVAYVILQGGDAVPDSQPHLEFWDKSSGIWRIKVSAPVKSDFEGFTFSVAELNSGAPGEAWFLAWGVPIGNSVGAEYLRLYSFDGLRVRCIWKRDHLAYGNVNVRPDTVTLQYQDEGAAGGTAKEVLHITPNGLE